MKRGAARPVSLARAPSQLAACQARRGREGRGIRDDVEEWATAVNCLPPPGLEFPELLLLLPLPQRLQRARETKIRLLSSRKSYKRAPRERTAGKSDKDARREQVEREEESEGERTVTRRSRGRALAWLGVSNGNPLMNILKGLRARALALPHFLAPAAPPPARLRSRRRAWKFLQLKWTIARALPRARLCPGKFVFNFIRTFMRENCVNSRANEASPLCFRWKIFRGEWARRV